MRFKLIDQVLTSEAIDLCKLEVGMLHLRQLTEVVAMACLIAQGDYQTQRAFREEHSPSVIFKALKARYPRFFPQPVTPEITASSMKLVANQKPNACSEKELVTAWAKAGDTLHRASLEKYLKRTMRPAPSPEPVRIARERLWALLEYHAVRIETETEVETLLLVCFGSDDWVHLDYAENEPELGWAKAVGFSGRLEQP